MRKYGPLEDELDPDEAPTESMLVVPVSSSEHHAAKDLGPTAGNAPIHLTSARTDLGDISEEDVDDIILYIRSEGGEGGKQDEEANARKRYIGPAVSIVTALLVLGLLYADPERPGQAVEDLLSWLENNGPLAPVIVFFLEIVLLIAAMPSSWMWVGVGSAFATIWGRSLGLFIACVSICAGVWVGSILAFVIGRYILRPYIAEWAADRLVFRAIDLAVSQRGMEVGLLLKLSPVIPLNFVNYALAVTDMPFWDYFVTCPAAFVNVIAYAAVGATVTALAQGAQDGGEESNGESWTMVGERRFPPPRLPARRAQSLSPVGADTPLRGGPGLLPRLVVVRGKGVERGVRRHYGSRAGCHRALPDQDRENRQAAPARVLGARG